MKVIPRANTRPGKDGNMFPIAWINGSICFFDKDVPVGEEIEIMITGRSKTQIWLSDGSLQPATLFVAPVGEGRTLMLVRGFESDYIRQKEPKPGEPTHRECASAFLSDDRKQKVMSGRIPVYSTHAAMGSKANPDHLHSCSVWVESVQGRSGLYRAVGLNDVLDIDHLVAHRLGQFVPTVRENNDERARKTNRSASKAIEHAFKRVLVADETNPA